MAFRQALVRRTWRKLRPPPISRAPSYAPEDDPVRYMLLIAGIMVMMFGITIACMATVFHLAIVPAS